MWSGKGASWLVGAGGWHGFEVLPAPGRCGDRGRCRGEGKPAHWQLHSPGDRNESHPEHFPSLVPSVLSFGRGRNQPRGRLFSARLE